MSRSQRDKGLIPVMLCFWFLNRSVFMYTRYSILYLRLTWRVFPSPIASASLFQTVGWGMKWRWWKGVGNNLQMKNNPFQSNAISRRADGQTEQWSCRSTPLQLKQRDWGQRSKGDSAEGWRDHSEGRGRGRGASQDIRMIRSRWGRGDIAGLAPCELDIESPCQVLPTLKDTWH